MSHTNEQLLTAYFVAPIFSALVLWGIYKAIQTNWPEAYTDVDTRIDEMVRSNPIRVYVLFRGLPVFLLTLLLSVIVQRHGSNSAISVVIFIGIHMLLTDVLAVTKTAFKRTGNWIVLVFMHSFSMISVAVAALFAYSLRNQLSFLVPSDSDLLNALWTALIVAALSTGSRIALTPKQLSQTDSIERLTRDVGEENWRVLDELVPRHTRKNRIARSLILAEAQQRPKWFRRLEELKGFVIKEGTYGVAQEYSSQPISDEASIKILVSKLNQYDIDLMLDLYGEREVLEQITMAHNPDENHSTRVWDIYCALWESYRY